jgi:hypothetical protein
MEFLRTRTTTAGTGEYAFQNSTVFKDVDWISVRRDSSSEYVRLDEISEEIAYERFSELTTGRGFPVAFARTAESYLLRAIPDASTYAIREKVWEYPADIATGSGSDSSTNFITLRWSKLLEFGVTARGFGYYEDTEREAIWTQLYRDELGKAVSVDRRRLVPSRLTLKPSGWAGRPVAGLRGAARRLFAGDYSWYP